MAKTIRFGDLVRKSGRPEVATLWVDPKKDPSFSKAVHDNRVLTIHSNLASREKEYGQIGFHEERGASYLVFPRPLPDDSDSRIVGINYELTEETAMKSARPAETNSKKLKGKKLKPATTARQEPKGKLFEVIVRRTATVEEAKRVRAATKDEAREMALKQTNRERFAAHRAIVKAEAKSVTEMES